MRRMCFSVMVIILATFSLSCAAFAEDLSGAKVEEVIDSVYVGSGSESETTIYLYDNTRSGPSLENSGTIEIATSAGSLQDATAGLSKQTETFGTETSGTETFVAGSLSTGTEAEVILAPVTGSTVPPLPTVDGGAGATITAETVTVGKTVAVRPSARTAATPAAAKIAANPELDQKFTVLSRAAKNNARNPLFKIVSDIANKVQVAGAYVMPKRK